MKLALPYPPSVNHYWRIFRDRIIVSKDGRKYRTDCFATILQTLGVPKTIKYRCRVFVRTHAKDNKRRDLDNCFKALLDALHHCKVIIDDSVIDHLEIVRGYVSADNPRVEVEILPMPEGNSLLKEAV